MATSSAIRDEDSSCPGIAGEVEEEVERGGGREGMGREGMAAVGSITEDDDAQTICTNTTPINLQHDSTNIRRKLEILKGT